MSVDVLVTRFVQYNVGGLRRDLSTIAGDFALLEDRVARSQNTALRTAALSSIAMGAMASVIGKSLQYAGEFQKIQAGFESVFQNAEKAKKLAQEIRTFDIKTPFNYLQVAKVSQMMLAAGFREDLIPALYAIGNATVASGGGADKLERLAKILSKIKAEGRLRQREVLQFAQAGVDIKSILRKQLGVDERGIMDVGKLRLTGEIVIPKLIEGFNEQYAGGIERAFQMLPGQIEALKGTTQSLLRDLGGDFVDWATASVKQVNKVVNALDNISKEHPDLAKGLVAGGFILPTIGTFYALAKARNFAKTATEGLSAATRIDDKLEGRKARTALTEAGALRASASAYMASASGVKNLTNEQLALEAAASGMTVTAYRNHLAVKKLREDMVLERTANYGVVVPFVPLESELETIIKQQGLQPTPEVKQAVTAEIRRRLGSQTLPQTGKLEYYAALFEEAGLPKLPLNKPTTRSYEKVLEEMFQAPSKKLPEFKPSGTLKDINEELGVGASSLQARVQEELRKLKQYFGVEEFRALPGTTPEQILAHTDAVKAREILQLLSTPKQSPIPGEIKRLEAFVAVPLSERREFVPRSISEYPDLLDKLSTANKNTESTVRAARRRLKRNGAVITSEEGQAAQLVAKERLEKTLALLDADEEKVRTDLMAQYAQQHKEFQARGLEHQTGTEFGDVYRRFSRTNQVRADLRLLEDQLRVTEAAGDTATSELLKRQISDAELRLERVNQEELIATHEAAPIYPEKVQDDRLALRRHHAIEQYQEEVGVDQAAIDLAKRYGAAEKANILDEHERRVASERRRFELEQNNTIAEEILAKQAAGERLIQLRDPMHYSVEELAAMQMRRPSEVWPGALPKPKKVRTLLRDLKDVTAGSSEHIRISAEIDDLLEGELKRLDREDPYVAALEALQKPISEKGITDRNTLETARDELLASERAAHEATVKAARLKAEVQAETSRTIRRAIVEKYGEQGTSESAQILTEVARPAATERPTGQHTPRRYTKEETAARVKQIVTRPAEEREILLAQMYAREERLNAEVERLSLPKGATESAKEYKKRLELRETKVGELPGARELITAYEEKIKDEVAQLTRERDALKKTLKATSYDSEAAYDLQKQIAELETNIQIASERISRARGLSKEALARVPSAVPPPLPVVDLTQYGRRVQTSAVTVPRQKLLLSLGETHVRLAGLSGVDTTEARTLASESESLYKKLGRITEADLNFLDSANAGASAIIRSSLPSPEDMALAERMGDMARYKEAHDFLKEWNNGERLYDAKGMVGAADRHALKLARMRKRFAELGTKLGKLDQGELEYLASPAPATSAERKAMERALYEQAVGSRPEPITPKVATPTEAESLAHRAQAQYKRDWAAAFEENERRDAVTRAAQVKAEIGKPVVGFKPRALPEQRPPEELRNLPAPSVIEPETGGYPALTPKVAEAVRIYREDVAASKVAAKVKEIAETPKPAKRTHMTVSGEQITKMQELVKLYQEVDEAEAAGLASEVERLSLKAFAKLGELPAIMHLSIHAGYDFNNPPPLKLTEYEPMFEWVQEYVKEMLAQRKPPEEPPALPVELPPPPPPPVAPSTASAEVTAKVEEIVSTPLSKIDSDLEELRKRMVTKTEQTSQKTVQELADQLDALSPTVRKKTPTELINELLNKPRSEFTSQLAGRLDRISEEFKRVRTVTEQNLSMALQDIEHSLYTEILKGETYSSYKDLLHSRLTTKGVKRTTAIRLESLLEEWVDKIRSGAPEDAFEQLEDWLNDLRRLHVAKAKGLKKSELDVLEAETLASRGRYLSDLRESILSKTYAEHAPEIGQIYQLQKDFESSAASRVPLTSPLETWQIPEIDVSRMESLHDILKDAMQSHTSLASIRSEISSEGFREVQKSSRLSSISFLRQELTDFGKFSQEELNLFSRELGLIKGRLLSRDEVVKYLEDAIRPLGDFNPEQVGGIIKLPRKDMFQKLLKMTRGEIRPILGTGSPVTPPTLEERAAKLASAQATFNAMNPEEQKALLAGLPGITSRAAGIAETPLVTAGSAAETIARNLQLASTASKSPGFLESGQLIGAKIALTISGLLMKLPGAKFATTPIGWLPKLVNPLERSAALWRPVGEGDVLMGLMASAREMRGAGSAVAELTPLIRKVAPIAKHAMTPLGIAFGALGGLQEGFAAASELKQGGEGFFKRHAGAYGAVTGTATGIGLMIPGISAWVAGGLVMKDIANLLLDRKYKFLVEGSGVQPNAKGEMPATKEEMDKAQAELLKKKESRLSEISGGRTLEGIIHTTLKDLLSEDPDRRRVARMLMEASIQDESEAVKLLIKEIVSLAGVIAGVSKADAKNREEARRKAFESEAEERARLQKEQEDRAARQWFKRTQDENAVEPSRFQEGMVGVSSFNTRTLNSFTGRGGETTLRLEHKIVLSGEGGVNSDRMRHFDSVAPMPSYG